MPAATGCRYTVGVGDVERAVGEGQADMRRYSQRQHQLRICIERRGQGPRGNRVWKHPRGKHTHPLASAKARPLGLDKPVEELGGRAVRLLTRRLENPAARRQTIRLTPSMLLRE